ncbi:MAG: AAA family ATPase [Verrucomicrobia bacterium]|nr:AAA family ATPase [Verrucomicrobiota bacterium]
MRFCAPTGAATEILRKEGFHAVTLESFLREDGRQSASKSIVVLDEAGAVGVDDMMRLLSLGVRVILSGDTGQHGSVKRGDALRPIEEHGSPYTFGHLIQIRRHRRGDYRRVVELAAKKQTAVASLRSWERLAISLSFRVIMFHERRRRRSLRFWRSQNESPRFWSHLRGPERRGGYLQVRAVVEDTSTARRRGEGEAGACGSVT